MDFEERGPLKNFYFALEDRYYNFLDRVDEHIPIYKIIDPIDRVFPSFILFLIVVILLIGGLAWLLVGGISGFGSEEYTGIIKLTDNHGNRLEGIGIYVLFEGKTEPSLVTTDNKGIAKFEMSAASIQTLITVSNEPGFEDFEETVLLKTDTTKLIILQSAGPAAFTGNFLLKIKDRNSELLINDQTITVSYSCDTGQAPNADTTVSGQVTVAKGADCESLYATVTPMHSYYSASSIEIIASPQNIFLEPIMAQVPTTGFLDVKTVDASSQAVTGATITIGTANEPNIQQSTTNSLGEADFELAPGSYSVTAFVSDDGRIASATADIEANQTTSIEINVGTAGDSKKIFLKIVDKNNSNPLGQVGITVYEGTTLLAELQSDINGFVEQIVVPTDKNFSGVIDESDYLLKLLQDIPVKELIDSNPTIVELEAKTDNPKNYGEALAIVSSETEPLVEDARVYLHRTDYPNPLSDRYSNDEGEALFVNLPPLTSTGSAKYFVVAIKSHGKSEEKFVSAGERIEFPVTLVSDTGNFKLTVKDHNSFEKIADADVRVFSLSEGTEETLQTGKTNSQGEFETMQISINQTVFFEVFATGFLTHTTTGFQAVANQTTELPPVLLSHEGTAEPGEIFFVFDYLLDELGNPAQLMEAGKRYWAVFSLGLPEEKTYSNPVAHVEAGKRDAEHLLAEENPVVIKNAIAFPKDLNAIVFSGVLDPSNPFADNPPIVGSGEPAKQVNVSWTSLVKGTFGVKVAVDTNSGSPEGTEIFLYFQSKARVAGEDTNSGLLFKRFVIGEPVCEIDCDAFFWRFYYSVKGEDNFQLVTDNPKIRLLQGKEFELKYSIYNLTDTTFENASLIFSTSDEELGFLTGNGFADKTIPPGLFDFGETNPLEFETLGSKLNVELDALLSTSPAVEDHSNETTIRFEIIGTKEMEIDYSIDPTESKINVILTDSADSFAISGTEYGGKVRIQKSSCSQNPNGFTFDPANPTFEQETTNSEGKAIFSDYALDASQCAIIEGSATDYAPKRKRISGSSNPNPHPDFECIQIDTNPETPEIDFLFDDAKRSGTYNIKVISKECPAANVRIHTLDTPELGNLISGVTFSPQNFSMASTETKTVQISIGETAPIGYIPIIAFVAKPGESFESYYAAFVEFVVQPRVSPNTDGFGIVEETK